jgi:hypothetical protein
MGHDDRSVRDDHLIPLFFKTDFGEARPESRAATTGTSAATKGVGQRHHWAAEAEALIRANPLHPWPCVWC